MKRISCIFFIFLFFLSGCGAVKDNNAKTGSVLTENNYAAENSSGNDDYFGMYVTRATAAKMLAVVFCKNIQNAPDCSLKDAGSGQWYDKYINAVCRDKIMSGDGEYFRPNEPLAYAQARDILKRVGINTGKNIKNDSSAISVRLWLDMFFGGIDITKYGVERKELSVFATADTGAMAMFKAATSIGELDHSGINIDFCLDKTIEAFVKNGEIVAINDIKSDAAEYKNVYMSDKSNGKVFILNSGERSFNKNTLTDSGFYDISVKNGDITSALPADGKVSDRIISYSNGRFVFEKSGAFDIDESFNAVKTYDGVCSSSPAELVSGCNYDFYIRNGKVTALNITQKYKPENMRVIISADKCYFHSDASFSCDSGIDVYAAGKKTASGNLFDTSQSVLNNGRVTLVPVSGKITLQCGDRSREEKSFSGKFDIEKTENGYLIINDVGFEDYIKGVVPSEMPSGYGKTAAMVQAVCARSYGCNEFYSPEYLRYGANCDDTVMCQVYASSPQSEISVKAVESTKGLCVCYNGEAVSTNFYASSCGSQAASGDVWEKNGVFPSESKPYLSEKNDNNADFSTESGALAFFKNMNAESYDSWSKWFRWSVTFSLTQLENTVIKNLPGIYDKNRRINENINLPEKCDDFLTSAGHLADMEITKRGSGGNVMALNLKFENKTLTVYTEYNIRMLLRPQGTDGDEISLYLKDGTVLTNYYMLPSTFFALQKWEDSNNKNFVLRGGGIGHGCGMSQNGVKQMSDTGFTMEQIIGYYYKGAQILEITG